MNDLGFHCGRTAQKVGGNQPLLHWARWLKAVWCGRHACFTINDGADLGMLLLQINRLTGSGQCANV